MAAPKLAVLAGRGPMPAQVIEAALAAGREVFVLAFEGETDPAIVAGLPHAWVALGLAGQAIRHLHEAAVEDVVMIGPMQRPSFTKMKIDFRGMQMLTRLRLRAGQGDNHLLEMIARELEGEGFRVIGADEIMTPLLAPMGLITEAIPSESAKQDIAHGIEVASQLGALDIGQAAVVQQGMVLGVEAIEGTDALLRRVGALKRPGPGGVLVKMKKPNQDRRADLPTIGKRTVEEAVAAGLEGIAVHAGHCLIVEREQAIARADRAGLFITGVGEWS
ncbi:MAG: LpxI family protein [Geminicoccaceae bacterium]